MYMRVCLPGAAEEYRVLPRRNDEHCCFDFPVVGGGCRSVDRTSARRGGDRFEIRCRHPMPFLNVCDHHFCGRIAPWCWLTVATSYHRYTCSGLSIVVTKPRSAATSSVKVIRQAWETNSVALPVYGTPLVGSVAPITLIACAREQEAFFVSGFTSFMQRSAVVYSEWACIIGWRASCSSSASDTPSFGKLGYVWSSAAGTSSVFPSPPSTWTRHISCTPLPTCSCRTHSFSAGTHRARPPGSLGSASVSCFFMCRMRAQRVMIGPLSSCPGRSRRCRYSAMLAALGPLYTSEYASEASGTTMGT